MVLDVSMLIGGEPVVADEWLPVINPAHTDTVVGRYPKGTAAHADAAVQAALAAFPAWKALGAEARGQMMLAASEALGGAVQELVPLLTQENGKVLMESGIDIAGGAGALAGTASAYRLMDDDVIESDAGRLVIRKQPYGVVVGIIPWNFPIVISMGSLAPALLAGNALVIKVPEFCPLATIEGLARVAAQLPPGVLNLVSGFGPDVGRALVTHPLVRRISFTGSVETGKQVMADAAPNLARLSLELGGNDAAVVLEDAVLDDTMINRMVTGAFMHTGQICFAIKRLFVHRSRYQELVDGISGVLANYVVGDGMGPEVTMGPINNDRQFAKVSALVADAKRDLDTREFGRLAKGTAPDDGYFVLPHLVLDPPDAATVVSCEQMGPILPILAFETEEEAVARANATEYGLCSSVWSDDREHAFAVADGLEAGVTFVNGHGLMALDSEATFGGVKHSGYGNESITLAMKGFVHLHSITDRHR